MASEYIIRELVIHGDGKCHWRLKTRNGEILCHSQTYQSKSAATKAAKETLNAIHDALCSSKPMMLKLKMVKPRIKMI